MYHSINIGNKNTWNDWHLIPVTRPVVNPPTPDYSFLDIPGTSGSLDLTGVASGEITYRNRTGSWDFYVDNEYGVNVFGEKNYEPWDVLYTNILNYLHGRRFTITLEDELAYKYEGRVSVNAWMSDPNFSRITLDYNLDPYKYEVNAHGEDWLWDPFDFETGVIDDGKYKVEAGETVTAVINILNKPVIPKFFSVGNSVQVKYKNKTYTVPKDKETTFNDILLKRGEHTFTLVSLANPSSQGPGEYDYYCDTLLTDLRTALASTINILNNDSDVYSSELSRIYSLFYNIEATKNLEVMPGSVEAEFNSIVEKYIVQEEIRDDLYRDMNILKYPVVGDAVVSIIYSNGVL